MSNSAFTPSTFGQNIVVPGVSPGQVSSLGLPGKTDGAAVTASYVGQKISGTTFTATSMASSGVRYKAAEITLTAGNWLIFGCVGVQNTITATRVFTELANDTSGTIQYANADLFAAITGQVLNQLCGTIVQSSTATYYFNVLATYTGATPTTQAVANSVFAIRIA